MVLEASRQLADENKQVLGYCIKDATFHYPLVVSREPQGVEIQLYVRSIKDSSDKDSALSEFRICVYEDGQWNENCRGTVEIEYDAALTEVDAGKEAAALQSHHRHLFDKATENCKRALEVKKIYEYLHKCGLEYGPAFQHLKQISCNDDDEAIAEVTVFRWSPDGNVNHPQPHIIHPTTLDAVAQLMLVALSKGGSEDIPTTIPTRIGKIWVSSTGISYPTCVAADVYARASSTGTRRAESSMFVLDQTTGNLLLSMEDAEATSVATQRADSQMQDQKTKLCYTLDWKPDMDMLDHHAALAYCEKARPPRISPVDFYEDLGYVLVMFISNTLEALAEQKSQCSTFHLDRYIQWMKHQIGKFDRGDLPNLPNINPKWTLLMKDIEYREALCKRLESTNHQGTLYIKVGRNLLKLLTGDLDPLSFMFQHDSIPSYYREVNTDVICFQPFVRYLEAMSHKNPGLKVLEIGAGVGSTTGQVLSALAPLEGDQQGTPRYARYDYTDISPAFFENAKDTYKSQKARMVFKALDIESDPSKQGFEAGTYDLIIAGSVGYPPESKEKMLSVLHNRCFTPPKIWKSLCGMFALFSRCKFIYLVFGDLGIRTDLGLTSISGGKLALYEITEDATRAGFAFGLLPGWWLSKLQALSMSYRN